ncbi:MAG: hypothetical protein ACTJHU_04605 [Mycetocola sp.]
MADSATVPVVAESLDMENSGATHRLINYTLVRVIARGSSSLVYAAHCADGEVALRVDRPDSSLRLLSRMAACGRWAYPILDMGQTADGALAVVMPLRRQTLAQARDARDSAIPEALFALCSALILLHDAGLWHGQLTEHSVHRYDGGWVLTGWKSEALSELERGGAAPSERSEQFRGPHGPRVSAGVRADIAALDRMYARLDTTTATAVSGRRSRESARQGAPLSLPTAEPELLPRERLVRDAEHWAAQAGDTRTREASTADAHHRTEDNSPRRVLRRTRGPGGSEAAKAGSGLGKALSSVSGGTVHTPQASVMAAEPSRRHRAVSAMQGRSVRWTGFVGLGGVVLAGILMWVAGWL